MTQKDKVKELVGRGLHSYHTKALQQMDRIEKKNKEQNHKISILTNELDNDYLTKTEEGSVVFLEHSKEGMVYLDELQGNTLVNYCTDGSKELTLNGDIDLEGTFVTTTEGVDNGKVDVMCEGNTLVNLYSIHFNYSTTGVGNYIKENNGVTVNNTSTTGEYYVLLDKKIDLKTSTLHTLIIDIETVNDYQIYTWLDNSFKLFGNGNSSTKFIKTFISGEESTKFRFDSDTLGGIVKFKNIMILEGDWTNKEIPPYFEGMKSVGQDDENGHKIEILSQNKNLFNINETDVYSSGTRCEKNGNSLRIIPTSTPSWASYNIKIRGFKNGETYALSCISDNYHLPKSRIALYEKATNTNIGSWDRNYFTIPNNVNVEDIYLRIHCCDGDVANIREVEISDILIEKGQAKTQFIPYAINKKEILLNEPLRKSNDNVKDRFVKIGNKYYIERNCQQLTINGNEPNVTWRSDGVLNNNVYRFWSNNFPNCITLNQEGCIYTGDYEKVYQANAINVHVSTSKITEDGVELFVEYLKQNPLTVVIKREKPIYEPIEDAELIAYLDTTHISNNSIIPCNMKVQNSGYNAIIKPSTLYTVTLDTNKSGTIGMNLGGVKGTTTNNVLTLTTPATLTDDSLRIYGKGIKGSKVRLLEGDKTNWIPSYFEGMKSSFEDKFDADDNAYKMEILSNNKNLVSLKSENVYGLVSGGSYEIHSENSLTLKGVKKYNSIKFKQKLKPLTKYYISCDVTLKKGSKATIRFIENRIGVPDTHTTLYSSDVITTNNKVHIEGEFTTKYVTDLAIYPNSAWETTEESELLVENLQISEVVCDFTKNKSNKIQFSSIEPLRKWDRFVFKDGQLMIERRTLEKALTKDMSWSLNATVVDKNSTQFVCRILPTWGCSPSNEEILCDKKPTKNINSGSNSIWVYDKTTLVLQMRYDIIKTIEDLKVWLDSERPSVQLPLTEPTYEEIPFELQKIILEGYENGTLFFDTNIPPTSTTTYAGETPIVKATKLNKTEVLSNTNDINDNIIPYLMDMDYRVVCLQLQSENINGGVAMARLFGGAYEMLQRDILSKRYSVDEYKHRLDVYLDTNKITEEEYIKLGDMLNE